MPKPDNTTQTLRRVQQQPEGMGRRGLTILALALSLTLGVLLNVNLVETGGGIGFGARLRPGDIADRSYKAPADLTLVDHRATAENRRAAVETAPVVYDFDERWGETLRVRIDAAFTLARQKLVEANPEDSATVVFSQALELPVELPESADAWLRSSGFSPESQAAVLNSLAPVLGQRIVDDAEKLARRSEKRTVIVRELGSKVERPLPAVDSVIGVEQAQKLVAAEIERMTSLRRGQRAGLAALAENLIRPSLSYNLRATDERRQEAESSVKDVTISLRKGEIIVRDGVPVTESKLRILDGIRERQQGGGQLGAVLATSALMFMLLMGVWRFGRLGISRFSAQPKDAVFLMLALLALALGTKLGMFLADAVTSNPAFEGWFSEGDRALYFLIPVATGAMLVRLVLSAESAALFSMLAAALLGLQLGNDLGFALYVFGGSLIGALGASRVSQRGTLLRAGVAVGAANVALILAIGFLQDGWGPIALLTAAAAGFLGGCLCGGVVTAVAPLVEGLFGYTTDVKLLELANREQPLLRELEIRAPGTYHHSMMVGHLAEKAAEGIGANALQAKVGGYYHDIGKMRRPHFFVENVTVHHGENRHEKLTPSMSARIIQAHVKDGLEMGRQNKLVAGIMQAIGEHHGTSIIRFFYEKAKELVDPEKGEAVAEHEYRYPGPKPQTREAGILMLADSVEAASRTLIDTSPARIQQLVQRTINTYFRDGQLDDCSLTLRDLNTIARSFMDTLSAIRHERIDYPAPTDAEGRKLEGPVDEGVVERLEPRQKDRSDPAPDDRGDDLKRLGLS